MYKVVAKRAHALAEEIRDGESKTEEGGVQAGIGDRLEV